MPRTPRTCCFGVASCPSVGRYLDIGAFRTYAPFGHLCPVPFRLVCGISIDPLAERVAELNALETKRRQSVLCCRADCRRNDVVSVYSQGRHVNHRGEARAEDGSGQQRSAQLTVPVRTLAEICATHWPGVTTYEFLKIDAEGAEAEILRGADLFTVCAPALLSASKTAAPASVPTY